MISADTRVWIRMYTEEFFPEEGIDKAIDRLDVYLEYIHDIYNDDAGIVLENIAEAGVVRAKSHLKSFVDPEQFLGRMGSVLRLTTPGKLQQLPHENSAPTKWTMVHLLKQAFCLFGVNDNLTALSSDSALETRYKNNAQSGLLMMDRKYHFLKSYNVRNTIIAHFMEDKNLSGFTRKQTEEAISSMLMVELELCGNYDEQLREVYEHRREMDLKSSYDASRYVQAIEKSYREFCDAGFDYLDTFWDISSDGEEKKNIEGFLADKGNAVTLFLGEAGTGKTTALRRLEYLFAKKSIREHGQRFIPVLIELKSLQPGKTPILYEIESRLKYSEDVAMQILKDGSAILLLDGWNEIGNKEVANLLREELKGLIDDCGIRVFVTDRSDRNLQLDPAGGITRCYLHDLSYDDKRTYFSGNCRDEEVLALLKEEIDREENGETQVKPVFNLKTPLMLYYFLKVVEEEHAIPKNSVARYIDLLFRREETEQKDADDPRSFEAMRYILAALAMLFEEGEFFTSDALVTVGKVKGLFGFNQPDSMQFLELCCKMGLLENADGIYRFKTNEFQDYFQSYAMMHGIDEALEVLR